METTAIERAIELTGGVLEDTDNDEFNFRLRTAIQLLQIIEEQHSTASDILKDCNLDEQTQEHLEALGYLG